MKSGTVHCTEMSARPIAFSVFYFDHTTSVVVDHQFSCPSKFLYYFAVAFLFLYIFAPHSPPIVLLHEGWGVGEG